MRIVSLLAGATELVCSLGAERELVGRSHECDWPEHVRELPSLTQPTFVTTARSAQVDADVRRLMRERQPLYRVDVERLLQLRPDAVITQIHCDVCAPGPDDVARDAPRDSATIPRMVSMQASTVEGIFNDFRRVAEAIGRTRECDALLHGFQEKLNETSRRVAQLDRPTIACIEWIDPIFIMANWAPEVVEFAGGAPLLSQSGVHSAATTWDHVCGADPQYILVAPCGFDIARTKREMHILAAHSGWEDLSAVRNDRVFVADGNRYFNRAGPSLFASVEILAQILHPNSFAPTYRGAAWEKYAGPLA
jgi:iron complex transport system substrate-binding protein